MIYLMIILAFLFLVNLLLFLRKNKGKKASEIDCVEEFHNNYLDQREEMKKHRNTMSKTNNYVTRYNSKEDYREK